MKSKKGKVIKYAAIYIRVSSKGQAKDGQGIDVQEKICRTVINNNGWELYKIYLNPKGVSGDVKAKNRPEFVEMIEDGINKKFSVVVVSRLDRLGRDTIVTIKAKRIIYSVGLELFIGSEQIANTDNAKMLSTIQASVGEYEKSVILKRMRDGMDRATEERGERRGKIHYGYSKIGKSKNSKIIINDMEAEVILMIYQKRDEGLALQKIANYLNEEGIKASRSDKWDHRKVSQILTEGRRKIYCGGIRNGWNELELRWPQILSDHYKKESDNVKNIQDEDVILEETPLPRPVLPPLLSPNHSLPELKSTRSEMEKQMIDTIQYNLDKYERKIQKKFEKEKGINEEDSEEEIDEKEDKKDKEEEKEERKDKKVSFLVPL